MLGWTVISLFNYYYDQPHSQGLSSSRPPWALGGEKKSDPGNEVELLCPRIDQHLISSYNINPFTPKSAKFQTEEKIWNFLQNCQKQTVRHHLKVLLNSFYLNGHTRVSSTALKVRTTFIDSRFDSGSERVNTLPQVMRIKKIITQCIICLDVAPNSQDSH